MRVCTNSVQKYYLKGTKMTDLSITIVAYKNYEDIINAVKSIEKYTSQLIKKRIYIVDNSEYSDAQKKDFKYNLSKYIDVKYIDTGKNLGFGKGNNYIINEIDSKYHAIVNPDILLKEDSFSKIIDYMEKNSDVGMCIPKLIDEHNNIQKAYRRELTIWDMFVRMFMKNCFKKRQDFHTMQDMDYSKPFKVPFGQGSFLVIRTNLFRQLNGFDDRYFMYLEDADLCKRVNKVSSLMYFPYTEVMHKWEKGSHKNLKLLKIHLQSALKYFKKWGFKFK